MCTSQEVFRWAKSAFEGIRVVELAQWVFVPVAGALLADWGADVVRIERPEGDPYRGLMTQGIGTDSGGVNLSIALANRGKRSVALDLRHEEGRAILHELLATADVFLTNFRPGALRRLGLDAETLTERYPSLVYARGHGYGVRGPDADRPGYDSSAFWARGGMAHVLTPAELDQPIGQRGAMGDRNGAMALAFGMAAALLERTRTGRGSVVDVSLLGTAMWTLSSDVLSALQGQKPRAMSASGSGYVNPLVGSYRTKDGRHIQLVFLEADRYWADFCRRARARRPGRRPPLRRSRGAAGARRGVRRRAPARSSPAAPSRSGSRCSPASMRRGRRCRRSRSCSTTRRWSPTTTSATSSSTAVPPYRLPTVPVQFDERPPALRRAPGARRALGDGAARARLLVGRASASCRTPA